MPVLTAPLLQLSLAYLPVLHLISLHEGGSSVEHGRGGRGQHCTRLNDEANTAAAAASIAVAAAAGVITAPHLPCRHDARCVHSLGLDSAAAGMPTGAGLP